jgi:hypothetical protein
MKQAELQAKITAMKEIVLAEKAKSKDDEKFQTMFAAGIDILGELFMDIKRIADSHSPEA